MKKVILTGDRPTGRLHVGHYVGSLSERVKLQNSGNYDEIYIMIADAQALTDNAEHPEKVRQNIIQVALDYLACGIDPDKSTIFIQSMVPELTELTFYYMNLVTVARVQRNPTVKAEIQMRNFEASIPVGFFCYPISQAADITAFRATAVPVGEDQLPMLEQCKEIVHKFNTVYGETLTEPEIVLPSNKACLRLPGIDGKAKMSKSLGNYIGIDESAKVMYEKAMRIPDDVLMDYFKLTTDLELNEIEKIMKEDVVEAHKIYAREIIKMYHGEKFINEAENRYAIVAQGGIPENIEKVEIDKSLIGKGMLLTDLLVFAKIVPSKSEGRRMIEQNGISINGNKENSVTRLININDFVNDELVIQKGKKQFKKIVLN